MIGKIIIQNKQNLLKMKNFPLSKKVKMIMGVEGFGYGSMGGFFTMTEVYARLDSMFALYPNIITQKFSIGTTVQGRPIYVAKISDNPNVNESEPQVFYNSLIHAREPQAMMTVMYYMYYLLENYGTDPEVTYLVNNREIYFQPIVNPDGYEYNRTTDPNGGGMFRKNRKLNSDGSYGIDLNRNFGYMWGYNNSGSSNIPSDETYRGTSAFSEPETQAYRDFVNSKNFKTTLNYHTYSNLLLYPWGIHKHTNS
jgi:carboxypeptidase T